MKIDGSQMADDLLQRMQEAHEQQDTTAVSDSTSAGEPFSVDELQRTRAPDAVQSTERSDLELRLEETAKKALHGEFSDASSVRGEVVEHILRDRWESKVGKAKTARMIRSLKPTLVDDPEFSRQVDEMLVMAARKLGDTRT